MGVEFRVKIRAGENNAPWQKLVIPAFGMPRQEVVEFRDIC